MLPDSDAAQALVQAAVGEQLVVSVVLPAQQEHHGLLLLLLAHQAGSRETDCELKVVFFLCLKDHFMILMLFISILTKQFLQTFLPLRPALACICCPYTALKVIFILYF